MQIEREKWEAWLFSQPKNRTFDWMDIRGCAVACFVQEMCSPFEYFSCGGRTISFVVKGKRDPDGDYFTEEEWPEWLIDIIHVHPINKNLEIHKIQKRYVKMFPDTFIDTGLNLPHPPASLEPCECGPEPMPITRKLYLNSASAVTRCSH